MGSILCKRQSVKIGDKFGHLKVAGPVFHMSSVKNGKFTAKQPYCVVQCDACGSFRVWLINHLKKPRDWSCGCLRGEKVTAKKTFRPQHWVRMKPIYDLMVKRCTDKSDPNYCRYGARGIYVCDEWKTGFCAFYQWAMASGYAPGLDLDRRDNNGPYAPWNCRFVTHKENMRNTRRNTIVEAWGERKCISQWLEDPRCAVDTYPALMQRLSVRHWDPEMAISTPKHTECVNKRFKNKDE